MELVGSVRDANDAIAALAIMSVEYVPENLSRRYHKSTTRVLRAVISGDGMLEAF
ncbi:hypothetical protein F444_22314 [Phytophthora nicotianae P1976]|uniref:Uncharacterized protein n=1 Tax=Phytophthora nicotianae P1976 TaxID=1317066 RepID=A0A080YY55_PHYNI|nr:hypothetical protein F444_22314 [Phytophthora nicotianae P1976]